MTVINLTNQNATPLKSSRRSGGPLGALCSFLTRVIVKIFSHDPERVQYLLHQAFIFGPRERVLLGVDVDLQNSFLNTVGGTIRFGDKTFCGCGAMFVTGHHDPAKFGEERRAHGSGGRDIEIGKGVWIGSAAIILGGVRIADDVVVAAGAVVTKDCLEPGVYAGVPARLIRLLK